MLSSSLLLATALTLSATSASPEAQWQTAPWGRWAMIPFQSAPFPSASRAQGYHNGPINFPANPYYIDNRVPVLVPNGVPPVGRIDFVVYLHGHSVNMDRRLSEGWPQARVADAGLPAVFLFPLGPKNVTDSDYGKLMEPGGLLRLLAEALRVLKGAGVVDDASVGRVVVLGHSGAYLGITRIMSDPAQRAIVGEVDLLDASYGDGAELTGVATAEHSLFRSVFTDHLAANNVQIMARLDHAGLPFHVLREADLTDAFLAAQKEPLFIHSQLGHDEIPDQYFARLLRTGVLGRKP